MSQLFQGHRNNALEEGIDDWEAEAQDTFPGILPTHPAANHDRSRVPFLARHSMPSQSHASHLHTPRGFESCNATNPPAFPHFSWSLNVPQHAASPAAASHAVPHNNAASSMNAGPPSSHDSPPPVASYQSASTTAQQQQPPMQPAHGQGGDYRQHRVSELEDATQIRANNSGRLRCFWPGCTQVGGYSSRGSLWRHVRTKHISPAAYVCVQCLRAFDRRDGYLAHVSRRQPQTGRWIIEIGLNPLLSFQEQWDPHMTIE